SALAARSVCLPLRETDGCGPAMWSVQCSKAGAEDGPSGNHPALAAFNFHARPRRTAQGHLRRLNMSFKTHASAAALGVTLGLSAAGAQQMTPPDVKPETSKSPVAGQITTQPEGAVLARNLIGQTVSSPDNAKIGSISDLLLSKDGKTVEGFVIGIGGFL